MTTNSQVEREFFDAIQSGQLDQVRHLVKSTDGLLQAYDYRNFGATPITSIAFRGADCHDLLMVDLLIELGADVHRRSDWWAGPWSPLHCACCAGNDVLAQFLIERGAIIDLHAASALGKREILSQLLSADRTRVHERGGDGCLPLHFAGAVDCAKLLIEHGADIEARCVDHFSTAVQYLSHIRPAVARYLFSIGAEADIFSAVLSGDIERTHSLIAKDPNVIHERIDRVRFPPGKEHDVQNVLSFVVGQNATAFHTAAQANRPEMLDILRTPGADLDVRGGYDDATPLHIAAWHDNFEVAQKLVDMGANIDLLSGKIHNNSPAGWAIVAGSHRVFSLLMDHRAQIHPWFIEDAQTGVDGGFQKYKRTEKENYVNILRRLQDALRETSS
jgi:ankyrin repeat protein